MIRETISVIRDFGRMREIAGIMIHYGLGDFVKQLGLGNITERAGNMLNRHQSEEIMHLEPAVRVRLAIQELGPTFVKLGQVLATRPDIFPPDWIAEFSKLQDKVPPEPFEALLPELEKALGRSPFEVFQELQTEAIAGASIAQVHLAKLQDGTKVVLKVRRPNVQGRIDADLRLLSHLARLLESEMPESRRFQPGKIVGQFAKSLRRELDLAMEARNTDRFAHNFADDPDVVFAKVHWEHTSEHLLVMEYIDGIPGNDLDSALLSGLNLKILGARGADAVLKMVLVDGFFHADPHPGNVFYLPGNRLAIIDCGMVGRISTERRDQIADLLAALVAKDIHALRDILIAWAGDAPIDDDKLSADVDELIFNYESAPLKHVRFSVLLNDLTTVMRENHLVVPPDLTMLFKALITLEGLGRQLDPDFQIVHHLTPFVKKIIVERYMPKAIAKRGWRNVSGLLSLATDLPRDLSRLLREARRGRVKIDLDLKRLDHFGHQLDQSTNRLTLGIITSALIIGSSIVMTVRGGTVLFGFLGFFLASLFGIWLIISIWRSGRD
ncbi:MAG TPA: AarF/UbiB family protein [Methylophilaceae bacterium]|nr:AarF/UbiB family protein [Methylophilaceae bacterium]HQR60545.1 AarF/UbiB family protein [Methylophilaceae bacterium]